MADLVRSVTPTDDELDSSRRLPGRISSLKDPTTNKPEHVHDLDIEEMELESLAPTVTSQPTSTSCADDDGGSSSSSESDIEDSDDDELSHSGYEKHKRDQCCLCGPSSAIKSIMFVPFFKLLLRSRSSEHLVHKRVMELWTLLGVVGAYFASIAHVGFIETPDFSDLEGSNAWDELYGTAFFVSLMVNFVCVLTVAFLWLLLTYVPKGSVKYSLGKTLFLMVLPAHFVFLGFELMLAAFIFLSRIVYYDSPETYSFAFFGSAIGLGILVLGYIYMALTRPKVQHDDQAPGCCSRCMRLTFGWFTFAHPFYTLTKSKLSPSDIHKRITGFWTTASIVGSVLGAASFEGLWNRVDQANGLGTGESLPYYSVCMYLSVMLSMWAVLSASLLMVTNLFYPGHKGSVRMLARFSPFAAFPFIFLVAGIVFFIIAIPLLTSRVFGTKEMTWVIALSSVAGFTVLLTIILIIIFATKPVRTEPRNHTSIGRFFTFSTYWEKMLSSKLATTSIYTRVSSMFQTISIVSAILVFLSFLLLQTFGEYVTQSVHLQSFSTAVLVALFLNLGGLISSLVFNFLFTIFARERVREWLRSRVNILIMPALFMLLGVTALLVSFPFLALILYPRYIYLVCIGVGGAIMLLMFLLRFYIPFSIPNDSGADKKLDIKKPSCFSVLTSANMFVMLLKSGNPEKEILDRMRSLFDALAVTAALLSAISVDTFREVPSRIQSHATFPVTYPDMVNNTLVNVTVMVNPTKAIDTDESIIYSISALLALDMNLLCLFLGSFYAFVLALLPFQAVRTFIYRMRHVLFLPGFALLAGFYLALISWWQLCEIEYGPMNVDWVFRGIAIGFAAFLFLTHIYLMHVVRRVASTFHMTSAGTMEASASDLDKVEEMVWESPLSRCCEDGCSGYCHALIFPWHQQLIQSGFSGKHLYQRSASLWSSLSIIGALLTAMCFLGIQEGLSVTTKGVSPSKELSEAYMISLFLSLCCNIIATVLSTLFLSNLTMIPDSGVSMFLIKLGNASVLPSAFIWFGAISFLAGFPVLGLALYGDTFYLVCQIVCWSLAGIVFLSVFIIHVLRGRFTHWFYDNHIAERRATKRRHHSATKLATSSRRHSLKIEDAENELMEHQNQGLSHHASSVSRGTERTRSIDFTASS